MLVTPATLREERGDEGMSLIELLVVVVILGIVVIGIFGVMSSLTTNEARTQNRVQTQETIRTALTDVARDLRSSGVLDTPTSLNPAQATAAQWVIGMTTDQNQHIRWRLDRTTDTLFREEEFPASSGTWRILKRYPNMRNGDDGTSFVRYYGSGNQRIETTTSSLTDLVACTLRVRITLKGAELDATSVYSASTDVALRNRGSRGVTGC